MPVMYERDREIRHSTFSSRLSRLGALIGTSALVVALVAAAAIHAQTSAGAADPASRGAAPPGAGGSAPASDSVNLSDSQLGSIRAAAVAVREFRAEKTAIGNIDFNGDRTVQVFTPYQGRILQAFGNIGDEVKKGQVLFTIESPDFISAQSNLISAAGTLDQTASALKRAKALYAVKGMNQNDYETAVANEQSAQGALRAARSAVAIFGRTEAQIDHIIATRQVETALVVKSPITCTITARSAAPGLLEQPGNQPAPYSVADLSTLWMVANVPEADSPYFKPGQMLSVSVEAFPGRLFTGKITAMGTTVDPNSRRIMVRSEIKDPNRELRPQMFATFVIRTGTPVHAPGVPMNGVVREGDGRMSVWVVDGNPHRFTRRTVSIGRRQEGFDEILDGVKAGETVAVDGAIFLSNILYGGAS